MVHYHVFLLVPVDQGIVPETEKVFVLVLELEVELVLVELELVPVVLAIVPARQSLPVKAYVLFVRHAPMLAFVMVLRLEQVPGLALVLPPVHVHVLVPALGLVFALGFVHVSGLVSVMGLVLVPGMVFVLGPVLFAVRVVPAAGPVRRFAQANEVDMPMLVQRVATDSYFPYMSGLDTHCTWDLVFPSLCSTHVPGTRSEVGPGPDHVSHSGSELHDCSKHAGAICMADTSQHCYVDGHRSSVAFAVLGPVLGLALGQGLVRHFADG